jgi:hypothetical protein
MRKVGKFSKIAAIGATIVASACVAAYYYKKKEPFVEIDPNDGAVLIVEPRKHPRFKETLDLFLRRVPSSWSLYVFCGSENEEFAHDATKAWTNAGRRVEIANLGVANLTADLYNALFKTHAFWDRVREETILVVQTDAVPCVASQIDIADTARRGFGYLGCAYGDKVGKNAYWPGHSFYGVGGLSLRRKSFCLKVCDVFPPGTEPAAEDVAFGDGVDLFASEYPVPTPDDLLDFCAQNAARPGRSWGAHQIDRQLPNVDKPAFFEYCPEAKDI